MSAKEEYEEGQLLEEEEIYPSQIKTSFPQDPNNEKQIDNIIYETVSIKPRKKKNHYESKTTKQDSEHRQYRGIINEEEQQNVELNQIEGAENQKRKIIPPRLQEKGRYSNYQRERKEEEMYKKAYGVMNSSFNHFQGYPPQIYSHGSHYPYPYPGVYYPHYNTSYPHIYPPNVQQSHDYYSQNRPWQGQFSNQNIKKQEFSKPQIVKKDPRIKLQDPIPIKQDPYILISSQYKQEPGNRQKYIYQFEEKSRYGFNNERVRVQGQGRFRRQNQFSRLERKYVQDDRSGRDNYDRCKDRRQREVRKSNFVDSIKFSERWRIKQYKKDLIRKQLKIFQPQEQLEILEFIKIHLCCEQEINNSQNKLKWLESLSKSIEQMQSLQRILTQIGLETILFTFQSRKQTKSTIKNQSLKDKLNQDKISNNQFIYIQQQ